MSHTPGPWRLTTINDEEMIDREESGVVIWGSYEGLRAWNIEDLVLATAAPELLAAIELLLAKRISFILSGDHGGEDDPDDAEQWPEVALAREAIAKARGEA